MINKLICNGKLIGIRIDDKYDISAKLIKRLQLNITNLSLIKISFFERLFRKKDIEEIQVGSITDFQCFLDICNESGITFNKDIFTFKCSLKLKMHLVSNNKLSSIWNTDDVEDLHVVLNCYGKIIALISFDIPRGYKGVHISMIEVFNKRRGIGSIIVKDLIDTYGKITAMTMFEAIIFWKKCGATTFDINDRFTITKEDFYSSENGRRFNNSNKQENFA